MNAVPNNTAQTVDFTEGGVLRLQLSLSYLADVLKVPHHPSDEASFIPELDLSGVTASEAGGVVSVFLDAVKLGDFAGIE